MAGALVGGSADFLFGAEAVHLLYERSPVRSNSLVVAYTEASGKTESDILLVVPQCWVALH